MEQLGQSELGFQGVVQLAAAQALSWFGVFALQVAGLYHEVADDSVEQQRVVCLLLDQLHEVVAVDGCLVVECNADVALGCLQQDFFALS